MKMISGSKTISGIIYRGQKYAGGSQNPSIQHSVSGTYSGKVEASANAEQTTGYPLTISVSAVRFKLYKRNDIFTPLNYLPKYNFVFSNKTSSIVDSLVLVYEGNEMFHIEGNFDSSNLFVAAKMMSSEITLSLVDENNEIFVADTQYILKNDIATTSQTVSFTSSTLTYTQLEYDGEIEEEINLPFLITSFQSKSRYSCDSNSSSIMATSGYKHKLL